MYKYYINKNQQKNGDYEIHIANDNCPHPADIKNRFDLGLHNNCLSAVEDAKRKFPRESHQINGCYYCCNSCHTT